MELLDFIKYFGVEGTYPSVVVRHYAEQDGVLVVSGRTIPPVVENTLLYTEVFIEHGLDCTHGDTLEVRDDKIVVVKVFKGSPKRDSRFLTPRRSSGEPHP